MAVAVALALWAVTLMPAAGVARVRVVQHDDPRIQDLLPLLESIRVAVRHKDIRPIQELQINWGEEDDLSNPRSDLYCILFDAACWKELTGTTRPFRAVRDIFLGAKPLKIRIEEYTVSSGLDDARKVRFRVIFYDAARVRFPLTPAQWRKRLHIDFVTWTFEKVGGDWRSPFGVFDTAGAEE
jgi:hypothetical protein